MRTRIWLIRSGLTLEHAAVARGAAIVIVSLLAVVAIGWTGCSDGSNQGGQSTASSSPVPGSGANSPSANATPDSLYSPEMYRQYQGYGSPVTPTPVPPRIEGVIVIKLLRGQDVAAGIPVYLLDQVVFQERAVTASSRIASDVEELTEPLDAQREELRAENRSIRDEAYRLETKLAESFAKRLEERRPEDPMRQDHLQRVLDSHPFDYAEEPLDPASAPDEAVVRLKAMRKQMLKDLEAFTEKATAARLEASELLSKEEEDYERIYRHKPQLEHQSRRRREEYQERLNFSPHERISATLEAVERELGETLDEGLAELGLRTAEWQVRLAKLVQHEAEVAERGRQMRLDALEEAIDAARVDKTFANDGGRFRFELKDGGQARLIHAAYEDPLTETPFVWLVPAVVGDDNNLSNYNTVGDPDAEPVVGLDALLGRSVDERAILDILTDENAPGEVVSGAAPPTETDSRVRASLRVTESEDAPTTH